MRGEVRSASALRSRARRLDLSDARNDEIRRAGNELAPAPIDPRARRVANGRDAFGSIETRAIRARDSSRRRWRRRRRRATPEASLAPSRIEE